MSSRKTWITGLILFLVCIVFSGLSVSLATVDDGVELINDPRLRPVAERSLMLASRLVDHPIEKIAFPASRVELIERRPGHCAPTEPGGRTREADFVVTVRYYTLFAIPGPEISCRCGGHYAIKRW